jgi:uncharacterized protein (TIGR03000 family)
MHGGSWGGHGAPNHWGYGRGYGGIWIGGPFYGYGYGYYPYYDYDVAPYYYPPAVGSYYQPPPVGATAGTGYQANYPPTAPTDNSAVVEVRIPVGAELWFDGAKTRQQGPTRLFNTPPLTPGAVFTYQVRASWSENGQLVNQTRTVQVEAGRRSVVDFTATLSEISK